MRTPAVVELPTRLLGVASSSALHRVGSVGQCCLGVSALSDAVPKVSTPGFNAWITHLLAPDQFHRHISLLRRMRPNGTPRPGATWVQVLKRHPEGSLLVCGTVAELIDTDDGRRVLPVP